ncbi:ImmA/IrrE family metallo-endopeptidase [Geodermatophilus sp. URMC 63]
MLVVETAVGQAVLASARRLGVPLESLAEELAVSAEVLDDLLRGRAALNAQLAARLATVLGGTPAEWYALESDEDDESQLVAAWAAAMEDFHADTLRALRTRGVVTATRAQPERLAAELAAFFGCRPEQVAGLVNASFRQSSAHEVHRDAVSTWLQLADRQATRLAEQQDTPPLSAEGLRQLLPSLAQVGSREPMDYLPEVQQQLAEVGVVLVFQADVKGSRLSGASWPSPSGYGVVALTLRYALDDYFWWTVFHECAHLVLGHGRVLDSMDADASETEAAADRLAQELLLPRSWQSSLAKPSKQKVWTLSLQLGVPEGLLVGQLQHAGRVARKDMNALKKRMPNPEDLEVRGRRRPSGTEWDRSMQTLMEAATRAS